MGMTAQSMLDKIKAAAPAPTQTSDPAAAAQHADAVLLALCQGIIDEIVANSELVPASTDSGSAGAGIIAGSVK